LTSFGFSGDELEGTRMPGRIFSTRVRGYNLSMRLGVTFAVALALAVSGLGADQPQTLLLPCPEGSPTTPGCNPSKKELRDARNAFTKGLKLQREKRTEEAFAEFESAARLSPRDVEYATAKEMARQQLVSDHLEKGNRALREDRQIEALAEFRSALNLDPQNQFAQERLRDAEVTHTPDLHEKPRVLADAGIVRVQPNQIRADFHYHGDGRGLLAQVASAFGITATIDDAVVSRQVRFDIQNVDFFTAMQAAGAVTHTFWTPLEEKQVLILMESPENHRQYDRMGLRTFFVPGVTAPTDLNDIVNLLRTVLEIRFVTPHPQDRTIVVRAPITVLDAATQLIESLSDSRPQVMLDVHVYEISSTFTRNMGLQIPNNFKLFNIPAGALAALGGQNIQDLINQLISSGGINQASSQALSALLAQLQGQQNSIFSQPLATFGSGLTLTGLSLGTASAQLSLNESTAHTLEHATLRVAQGNEATFRVGSRLPILNASFAPIFNTPAISQVIQNNSFQAAFPSFNYEDIGLSMKAKPLVNGNSDVNLQLELQFRTLQGQSFNGVPVIANREYKGSITLTNGEPAVVAGSVSRTEQRSLNGIPGLGAVPVVNHVMVSNSKEVDEDELLIVITPRLISQGTRTNAEVYLTK
jgi:general secretion pathway protein D